MTKIILIFFALLFLISLATMAYAIATAPLGEEDEMGFRLNKKNKK